MTNEEFIDEILAEKDAATIFRKILLFVGVRVPNKNTWALVNNYGTKSEKLVKKVAKLVRENKGLSEKIQKECEQLENDEEVENNGC